MTESPLINPLRPLGALCFVADVDVLGEALERRTGELLAVGLPSVQLRAKGRSTREIVRLGAPLRDLAARAGASFVVNGDPGAAAALDADGVHLPAGGAPVAQVRARLPDGVAVGVSCHDEAELVRAAGADWVFVSPVFPTASKPDAPGLGLSGLGALVARARPPVYALGGVDLGNASRCLDAGAVGIAAIRGLAGPEGEALVRALVGAS